VSYTGMPTPPTAGRPPSRVPLWIPLLAGLAVVAVISVAVGLIAGGGTKSGTTVAVNSSTEATTTTLGTTTTTTTTTAPPQAGGSWTVLVYGAGDNNLEADLLGDLEEMAAVPAAALDFYTLVDRTPDYTDASLPGIGNWTSTKLINITPNTFTEVADLGELNTGDPAVLADFVARGIAEHPADHYALILWDHGSIAGVASDDTSNDALSVPEIASGIRQGLDRAGLDHVDILGFDACLMGAYEVAASMTGLADYMLASEEVEPNDGWDYSAFGLLAAQPDQVTAQSLGAQVVASYVATSAPYDPTVTMSLIDLRQVGALVQALSNLDGAVVPDMPTFASAIGRGRSQAPSFGSSPVPDEDFFMVDLGVLLQNLSQEPAPLGDSASAALAVLNQVIVASQTGNASAGATGMTIHFPPYQQYYYPAWYRATAAPVWPDFLEAYYNAGTQIPADKRPTFAPIGNQASHYFDDYGLNVEAVFNSGAVGNIVEATLYTGVVEADGSVTFIGEDQGLYQDNQAVASNDLTRLQLDDGQDQAYAYQDISFNEDLTLFILDVPLAYYPPGVAPGGGNYQDVTLKLTYNIQTDEFTEDFYTTDEFGTVGQFQADPNGLIVPVMLTWHPDGTLEWVQTSDVGLWADLSGLTYSFPKLQAGTHLYAELYVYDYGGNYDYAAVDDLIPANEAPWQTCTNTTYGLQISYPAGWFVWDSPTPDLACAYFDPSSMTGLTADEAFNQAALTVEVLQGDDLASALDFLTSQSATSSQTTVSGHSATVYDAPTAGFGWRAYVIPLDGADGPTLVLAAWGEVNDSLREIADHAAGSLVLLG
jgi:hypothetical protein